MSAKKNVSQTGHMKQCHKAPKQEKKSCHNTKKCSCTQLEDSKFTVNSQLFELKNQKIVDLPFVMISKIQFFEEFIIANLNREKIGLLSPPLGVSTRLSLKQSYLL